MPQVTNSKCLFCPTNITEFNTFNEIKMQQILWFVKLKTFKIDLLTVHSITVSVSLHYFPSSSPSPSLTSSSYFLFSSSPLPADVGGAQAAGEEGVFLPAASHRVCPVCGRGEWEWDLSVYGEDEPAGTQAHAGRTHRGGSGREHRARLTFNNSLSSGSTKQKMWIQVLRQVNGVAFNS